MPLAESKSMLEVSLPTDFEQHCPGGLSTLATKARAIMAAHHRSNPKAAINRALVSLVETEPTGEEPPERSSERDGPNVGGKKRLRDSGSAGGVVRDSGGMSAFEDEVVGSAAAIAVFGWRSVSSTAGSPSKGDSEGTAGSEMPPSPQRLQCALCSRRLVTDNFSAADVGPGASPARSPGNPAEGLDLGSSVGGGARSRGKRRRLSGGGTPLKAMDIAAEHRAFCPWATVHPAVEGEPVLAAAT